MNRQQRDRVHKLEKVGFVVATVLASVVIVLSMVALIFKIVV